VVCSGMIALAYISLLYRRSFTTNG
jgi:hypothetical protein